MQISLHNRGEIIKSATGIIINCQTPVDSGPFPRAGGTGYAIKEATGLPEMHMHRDGFATKNEQVHLSQLTDGSIIFITGHGLAGSEQISGKYFNHRDLENKIDLEYSWDIKTFVKLILTNSELAKLAKSGARPKISIVLWICYSGQNKAGLDNRSSLAARLCDLLDQEGIDADVIANLQPTLRFHGFDKISNYSKDKGLPFGAFKKENIIIFEQRKGLIKSHGVSKDLFFNKNGVSDFEFIPSKISQLESRPDFVDSFRTKTLRNPLLLPEITLRNIIIDRSTIDIPYYFSATITFWGSKKQTQYFKITADNTIEALVNGVFVKTQIQDINSLFPESIPVSGCLTYDDSENPLERISLLSTFMRESPTDTNKQQLLTVLTKYIDARSQILEKKSAKVSEYFHHSFFSMFQKSYTQKRASVDALIKALFNEDVDLKPHLSTLKNGTLGIEINNFLRNNDFHCTNGVAIKSIDELVKQFSHQESRLKL